MFKDITLGQYYQTDSLLHRLDPRVKLVGTLVYIISLFVVDSFTGYIIAGIFLAAMIVLSNVPVGYIVRGMRAILILLLITMSFNLFLTPGQVIFRIGFLKITREGLAFAIKMAIRLSLLVIGSSLMTLTTTPNQLTDAIESLLGPLKRFRVPVHEIAMMMSIALRFIPILMEETDKIMAQIARVPTLRAEISLKNEEPCPAPRAAVYLGFPPRQRPRHGHGGQMLQRRRREDQDETAGVSGQRPGSLPHPLHLFCGVRGCESSPASFLKQGNKGTETRGRSFCICPPVSFAWKNKGTVLLYLSPCLFRLGNKGTVKTKGRSFCICPPVSFALCGSGLRNCSERICTFCLPGFPRDSVVITWRCSWIDAHGSMFMD